MKTYCILFIVSLLGSCVGVKEGCNYPDPAPMYNEEGKIMRDE